VHTSPEVAAARSISSAADEPELAWVAEEG
jgi:hypothetical protein